MSVFHLADDVEINKTRLKAKLLELLTKHSTVILIEQNVSTYYEIFPAKILRCVDSKMISILSQPQSVFFQVALTLTRMHIGAIAERAPMAGATKTTLELRQLCNNFLRLCMRSCMNQRFTRMLNISYSQFVTFTMQQLQQSLICATTSFLLHAKNMILFLKLSNNCLCFSPQKAMGSSGSTGSCFGCTLCPLSLSSSSLSSLTARSS